MSKQPDPWDIPRAVPGNLGPHSGIFQLGMTQGTLHFSTRETWSRPSRHWTLAFGPDFRSLVFHEDRYRWDCPNLRDVVLLPGVMNWPVYFVEVHATDLIPVESPFRKWLPLVRALLRDERARNAAAMKNKLVPVKQEKTMSTTEMLKTAIPEGAKLGASREMNKMVAGFLKKILLAKMPAAAVMPGVDDALEFFAPVAMYAAVEYGGGIVPQSDLVRATSERAIQMWFADLLGEHVGELRTLVENYAAGKTPTAGEKPLTREDVMAAVQAAMAASGKQ